ncbi:hypothetical protein FRX31_026936, partial [Thalictrum thalictroides]
PILRLPVSASNLAQFVNIIEEFQRTKVYLSVSKPSLVNDNSKGKSPIEDLGIEESFSLIPVGSGVTFEDDPVVNQFSNMESPPLEIYRGFIVVR